MLIVRQLKLIISVSFILFVLGCSDNRPIKYSGFDDLTMGSETLYLYENGDFSIEIGLGYHDGTYIIRQDSIFLTYKKPSTLPSQFILEKEQFRAINHSRKITIPRIDKFRGKVGADPLSPPKEMVQKVKPVKQFKKYYYVSSIEGAPYFSSPNGELIGRFLLNQGLLAIEKTNVFTEQIDSNSTKHEWLGLQYNSDTVYILDKHLSTDYTYLDIDLYDGISYNANRPNLKHGFVNLTNAPIVKEIPLPKIPNKQLGKHIIPLSKTYRDQFLKRTGIKESDFIFTTSKSFKIQVKNLPLIASLNHYRLEDEYVSEGDYEIGFELDQKYDTKGMTYIYIGTENVFKINSSPKPIVWEEVKENLFPLEIRKPDTTASIYSFNFEHWTYYLRNQKENQYRQLVVVDTNSQAIVFNKSYNSSESTHLPPIKVKGKLEPQRSFQKTGYFLKGKPPVILGIKYVAYSCEVIEFIEQSEPPIVIRCDNRD